MHVLCFVYESWLLEHLHCSAEINKVYLYLILFCMISHLSWKANPDYNVCLLVLQYHLYMPSCLQRSSPACCQMLSQWSLGCIDRTRAALTWQLRFYGIGRFDGLLCQFHHGVQGVHWQPSQQCSQWLIITSLGSMTFCAFVPIRISTTTSLAGVFLRYGYLEIKLSLVTRISFHV